MVLVSEFWIHLEDVNDWMERVPNGKFKGYHLSSPLQGIQESIGFRIKAIPFIDKCPDLSVQGAKFCR